MKRWKSFWKSFYLLLVFAFLYAPILVLVAQSFNSSKYRGNWSHFTLKWYGELFENEGILSAFVNTMTIGFISAAAATVIGLVTCMALAGMRYRKQAFFLNVSNISMLNADIVTGISLMLLFLSFGIRFGYGSVLLSHIIFNVPYAILNIMPGVNALDKSVYESALDLGAPPVKAFFHVVLPELMPSVISGFLMALTMSMDDFIITHFTKGAGVDTLPTKIYAELKLGIRPEMYALTTLMTLALLLLFALWRMNRSRMKNTTQILG